jgi:hypothetical protein
VSRRTLGSGVLGLLISTLPLLVPALTNGVAAAAVGAAPEAPPSKVLYDQTKGTPTGYVRSMQSGSFGPELPGPCGNEPGDQSCFAADDFTIPPGPAWNIENVHVDGRGGVGDVFRWEALEAGGLPPGEEGDPFQLPAGGESVVAGAGFTTEAALPGSDDFDIPVRPEHTQGFLDGDPALPPGHYWLSVSAAPPFSLPSRPTPSVWEWEAESPAESSPAAWSAGQCDPSFAYRPLAACGQAGPDLRFRIEGQRITKSFSSMKIGRMLPTPDGGLNVAVTFPGAVQEPGLTVKEVAGPGTISTSVKYYAVFKHGKPENMYGAYTGGPLPAVVKVRPRAGLAAALREGRSVKVRLELSYKRAVDSEHAIAVPAGSKTVAVVLKK